jgi:hypothetical protein
MDHVFVEEQYDRDGRATAKARVCPVIFRTSTKARKTVRRKTTFIACLAR